MTNPNYSRLAIINILRSDGSIVINKALMKAIGINETIVFSELLSRYCYFETREQLTEDGYFYNTVTDLEEATTLNDYHQRKAINSLVVKGLINVEIRGIPPVRYFKITEDTDLIVSLIMTKIKTKILNDPNSEKIKELNLEKLDTNNTKSIILNNDNDNGVFPEGKDSYFINKDVVNAIKTYMNDLYKQRTKKKHPYLKPNQYKRVYDSIDSFAEENSLDYDGIVEVMICYLNNKALDTDWNINHFATEGIMLNRMYESGLT